MAVSIQIQGLVKRFGATTALDRVTLDIQPGELFFLLGPSGCGKTTLLRHVAGFYEPDEGRILIGGEDVTRVPPHRRDTGMVFQSYALWPHMTLAENVAFGLRMRGVGKAETAERVRKALAAVKMEDKASRKPNQLSGGQQQRVALARALVVQPRCLLLDEPLSNLDAKLRLEMRGEIRRICKEAGLTAVYVTHDQKEALSIADRIAVMQAGRLEQVGAPLEVYRKPKNRFVASFIGETNFLPPDFFGAQASFPGAAALSVRPETVRLGKPPAFSKALRFSGTVHGTVYLGETAEHLLDTGVPGVPELKVFELNPAVLARDESRRAEAWVAPSDVVPLPS
ncbi:MAG: ABC transporter ATP-binding protein [Kiritimatiellae bacterium]|nr:ABC transporter ATP-binding protein [Kiritimatiellia bacterium]